MDNSLEYIRDDLISFMSLFHKLFAYSFRKDSDDKYNCTKNQIRAIMIIGKTKKITPTLLGKCMNMEKGSITTLIDTMENLGLVYRKDDLNDKRKVWIHLTEDGAKYYLLQEKKFINQIEKLFSTLSKEEIVELGSNLKNIVTILEKVRDKQ